MRRPPDSRALRPLAGQHGLFGGDVCMLLRRGFYPAAERPEDLLPEAWAAANALQAIVGIPESVLADICYDTAAPEGAAALCVPIAQVVQIVALPATALHLVLAWTRVRPPTNSDRLFVRLDGKPLNKSSFHYHAGSLAAALGLDGSLSKHLRAFFVDSFYRYRPDNSGPLPADENLALERYLRRLNPSGPRRPWPLAASEARLVFRRADPFAESGTRSWAEPSALAYARSFGTKIPDTYLLCWTPVEQPAARRLTDGHPLLVDLSKVKRGRNGRMVPSARLEIFLRHRDDLLRRAAEKTFPHHAAADLLELKRGSYRRFRHDAARSLGERNEPVGRAPAHAVRILLSNEERARLDRIEALVWPAKPKWPTFRRGVLRKHASFLFALTRHSKLAENEAAQLLKVNRKYLIDMRLDLEAGVFEHWLRVPVPRAELREWQALVREKRHERRPGQSDAEFVRDLRKRYDLPIHYNAARHALHKDPAPRKPVVTIRIAKPLAEFERKRLERISNPNLPRASRRGDQSLALMKQDGAFVFGLILEGRLRLADAARLFKISISRASELLGLHREGDLAMALERPAPAEAKRRLALFMRELQRRGAQDGISELLRDMRRRLRVYIPATRARLHLHALDRAEELPPVNLPKGRVLRARIVVPLEMEERRRLRAISSIDWNVEDIGDLRRRVLADDGDFVVKLFDKGKLGGPEAAKLVRISPGEFSGLRSDWKAGLRERYINPPPQGNERLRQREIVREEARQAPSERLETFIVRLGRDRGVLLPRWEIQALRNQVVAQLPPMAPPPQHAAE